MLNSTHPFVSVLIPAFNCATTIDEAVESVIHQTYSNIEIVIINDYSTDNTQNRLDLLASRFANVRVYKNESNLGYLKTFNKLLSLAQGDVMCFVDSDDWISPNKINDQVDFLVANPDHGLVGTGFSRTDSKGRVYENVLLPQSDSEIKSRLDNYKEVCFCGSSVMITREIYEQVGGYQEYFIGCPAEDYDWIRRISNITKCHNLSSPMYFYRFNENSLTRNVKDSVKAQFAPDIAFLLDKQRATNNGLDALTSSSLMSELDAFLQEKSQFLKDNPVFLIEKHIINHAIRREYKLMFSQALSACKLNLLQGLKSLCKGLFVCLVPNNTLLLVKAKLKEMRV